MMMQIASIAMASLMMMGTQGNLTTAEIPAMESTAENPAMEAAPEVYATETGILLNFPDGTGYYIEF